MPPVNYYIKKKSLEKPGMDYTVRANIIPSLQDILAKELSCSERTITPADLRVRVIPYEHGVNTADHEIEVTAQVFEGRIGREDAISTATRDYLTENYPTVGTFFVLTKLCILGYSRGK